MHGEVKLLGEVYFYISRYTLLFYALPSFVNLVVFIDVENFLSYVYYVYEIILCSCARFFPLYQ